MIISQVSYRTNGPLVIRTLYCLLGQDEEGSYSVIRVPLFRVSVCYDKLHCPKIVG